VAFGNAKVAANWLGYGIKMFPIGSSIVNFPLKKNAILANSGQYSRFLGRLPVGFYH